MVFTFTTDRWQTPCRGPKSWLSNQNMGELGVHQPEMAITSDKNIKKHMVVILDTHHQRLNLNL
jgi:hypothetical protein